MYEAKVVSIRGLKFPWPKANKLKGQGRPAHLPWAHLGDHIRELAAAWPRAVPFVIFHSRLCTPVNISYLLTIL